MAIDVLFAAFTGGSARAWQEEVAKELEQERKESLQRMRESAQIAAEGRGEERYQEHFAQEQEARKEEISASREYQEEKSAEESAAEEAKYQARQKQKEESQIAKETRAKSYAEEEKSKSQVYIKNLEGETEIITKKELPTYEKQGWKETTQQDYNRINTPQAPKGQKMTPVQRGTTYKSYKQEYNKRLDEISDPSERDIFIGQFPNSDAYARQMVAEQESFTHGTWRRFQ